MFLAVWGGGLGTFGGHSHLLFCEPNKRVLGNFPGGPVVKNPSCNAADESLIPDQGTNIPHAALQLETLHCNEGSPVSLVLHQWKEIWVLWTLVYRC